MKTLGIIVLVLFVVGIVFLLAVVAATLQAMACNDCPYKDVCLSSNRDKDFVPPCRQHHNWNDNTGTL